MCPTFVLNEIEFRACWFLCSDLFYFLVSFPTQTSLCSEAFAAEEPTV